MNTHDYTKRYWGHDFAMYFPLDLEGIRATVMGWGKGIEVSDYIIFPQTDVNTTRYQVEKIEYYNNPPDMWRATVRFAPR